MISSIDNCCKALPDVFVTLPHIYYNNWYSDGNQKT